jgi:hypothetical protein
MLNDAAAAHTGGAANEIQNFVAWLNTLTERELKSFSAELDSVARRVNLDLNWAVAGYVGGQVRNDLLQVLLLHALAIWHTQELQPLVRLENYRADPDTRANRAFAQRVFSRLPEVDTGAIPPDMMLAPERERSRYVYLAIDRAWKSNPDGLLRIVAQVLREPPGMRRNTPREVKTVRATIEPKA